MSQLPNGVRRSLGLPTRLQFPHRQVAPHDGTAPAWSLKGSAWYHGVAEAPRAGGEGCLVDRLRPFLLEAKQAACAQSGAPASFLYFENWRCPTVLGRRPFQCDDPSRCRCGWGLPTRGTILLAAGSPSSGFSGGTTGPTGRAATRASLRPASRSIWIGPARPIGTGSVVIMASPLPEDPSAASPLSDPGKRERSRVNTGRAGDMCDQSRHDEHALRDCTKMGFAVAGATPGPAALLRRSRTLRGSGMPKPVRGLCWMRKASN